MLSSAYVFEFSSSLPFFKVSVAAGKETDRDEGAADEGVLLPPDPEDSSRDV